MNKKILSVVLILCVMLAVMPMTAYAADRALCTKCGQSTNGKDDLSILK